MNAVRTLRAAIEAIEAQPRWAFAAWLGFCGTYGMVGPDVVAWLAS